MDVTGITYDAPVPQPIAAQPPAVSDAPQNAEAAVRKNPAPQTNGAGKANGAAQGEKENQNPVNKEVLEKTLHQINRSIAAFDREMHIRVHEKTNRIMVKVMDTEENKVIREIPPEKVLDAFAQALELAGILLDKSR